MRLILLFRFTVQGSRFRVPSSGLWVMQMNNLGESKLYNPIVSYQENIHNFPQYGNVKIYNPESRTLNLMPVYQKIYTSYIIHIIIAVRGDNASL